VKRRRKASARTERAAEHELILRSNGQLTGCSTPHLAGIDVGRTRYRSELTALEEIEGRFVCRMLRNRPQRHRHEPRGEPRAELPQCPA
jgi:hypothetical protein